MADVTSRLRLVVDSTGLDRAGRKLKDIQRGARDADAAATRLKSAFAGLAGVLGAAFSVREITKAVDSYRQIENQLRLVTSSARELKAVQEGVLAVANATGASLDTTARLYANLERFAGQFLKSQQDTLDLTRAINQAAAVSGAGVQEASNAIRQLTQGLAGGVLRAEEFNSVIENLPRLGQAIADGLGIGIGELRRQVNDGLITSEKLVTAIQSQFATLNDEFLGTSRTIAQALTGLGNLITVELGQRLSGVQDTVVGVLVAIGQNLDKIIPLIEGAAAAIGVLGAAFAASSALAAAPAILAAIVSPLGLIAIAIGTVVALRDDIAEWAFGVRDAGAVVQAAVEALRPSFVRAFETIKAFVASAIPLLRQFADATIEIMRAAADAVSAYVGVINDAISRVRVEAKTRELEGLVAKQKELTDRLKANAADFLQDQSIADGNTIIKKQLDEVNKGIASASDELNRLLNPSNGVEKIKDVFGDIADRAKEIANAKMAAPIEEADKAGKKLVKTTEALTKEQKKAQDALAQYKQDLIDQQELIRAAGLGEREERIAAEVLRIRRQIKDITVDEARALAEQNVELEIQLDLIHEQRRIMEEPFRNLADNLTDAIINGGRAGVGGLKKIFGSFLNDLKRAFLYQVFNPLIQSLSASLGGLFGVGIFTPGINGGNPENAVSGSLLAAARTNGVSVGGLGLGQAALGFGGLAAGGASSIFGLASLIGPGNLGRLGAGIGNFLGLSGNVTGGLSKALAGAGTFGGALGGIGGSLLSGALFGKSKGQSIGSTIGGIGGSFFGPIGSAIGSFLGGAIGSLFGGTKKSAASISTFSGGLDIGSSFGKGSGRQEQALSLGGAVIDSLNSLASVIGGQIVAGLNLGSIGTRKSNFIFDPTGANRTKGAGVQSFASEEQAIRAAINAAIGKGVISGDSALIQLTKSLAGANVGLEQMASVLGLVKQITDSGKPAVSKYGEALKELDAALQAATASAHGSLQAEQALASARAQAVAALKGQFEKDVATAIEEIKDPAVASFRELAKGLASTLSDAKSLGVDVSASSQVMELIGLQVEQFFEQAASNGGDIVALTTKLSELGEILKDLGVDANIAAQALAKAKANQKSLFDQQVQNDIVNFLNGPLDQLEKLLEAQKTRLEQAEALGADLSQVERLSALELRQFFQGLSESALNEVRDFLGLFEEAADSVARNLDLSRQDLRAKADQFQQFAEQFSSLATDFRERFVAASPRESVDILRARATDLLGQVGQGNESAAQALPQVLNQLVESARQTFGNTKGFQDVLEFALGTLSEAEKSAIGVKTEAERQIAALDESNDLLSEIRDILQSTQAFNALLSSANAGGVASAGQLLDLIRGGAGLTPNPANDNAAALSVTALIGQSLTPIINPLVSSIDGFTQQVAQMPYLQRLQIDATDRVRMAVEDQTARLEDKLDRLEVLSKQQLAELEAA